MHRVNASLPPSWAYVRHEIISGRTGLPVPILVYPLHTIFPHQSTGETQNCTFIYNCSVNVSTEEHLLQRCTIHVSNLADNMCMGNEKGVINWYQPPRSTPPSCQNREREEKKKKRTLPVFYQTTLHPPEASTAAILCYFKLSMFSKFVPVTLPGTSQFVCVEPWACRKAAALLTATVGKASRQNSVTPSKRVDGFQVLS